MEAVEQRWGFLAPWCEVLKKNARMRYITMLDEHNVWSAERPALHVSLSDRSAAAIDAVREALALLAAVNHVEYAAWRFLLEKYCEVDLGCEGEEKYEAKVPVLFVLETNTHMVMYEKDVFESDLVLFAGAHQREHTSPEFEDALDKIAAFDKTLQGQAGVEIEIPLRVDYRTFEHGIEHDLVNIRKAERIIDAEWELYRLQPQEVKPGSLRCTFVLARLPRAFGDAETMEGVMELVDLCSVTNVWFPYATFELISQLAADNIWLRKGFGELMAQLLRCWSPTTGLRGSSRTSRTFEVEGLEILARSDSDIHPLYLEALFSAVKHSQATEKLSLGVWTDPLSSQRWWGWAAYALFSKQAPCAETLTLVDLGSLTTADMEAFSRVLTSEHPEELLFQCPRGKVDDRNATLRVGATIICLPRREQGAIKRYEEWRFESPIHHVRTFSDDGTSEWINALVPGFGRCHVQRASLIFDDSTVALPPSRQLTSLRIHFDKEQRPSSEGLPQFLEMVGAPLKFLALDVRTGRPDNISLLESCPQLEELVLTGGFFDAQIQFDEYHAKHHGEPFPVLCYDWYNVTAIATLLADPNSLLAKCVRRLRVRPCVKWCEGGQFWDIPDTYPSLETDCNALVAMLSVNQRLEFLDINVPKDNPVNGEIFRVHHNEPISRVAKPLSLESRLAFLSVLPLNTATVQPGKKKPRASPPSRIGQGQLNHDVLMNIFSFAAFPVLRKVYYAKSNECLFDIVYKQSLPW